LRQRLPHGNAREIKPSCALTTHAVQDARSKCFRRGERESSEEVDLYFVCKELQNGVGLRPARIDR
jgi:hypothetical protein